ncbi:hypothetical protein AB0M87_07020 [Streptomyces sp. NPDC051320]|uniref:hypothetical protein n=1 Tax=Streptomyces sp. NPDC051320 TaxID=3154644 RepID=UPI0034263291
MHFYNLLLLGVFMWVEQLLSATQREPLGLHMDWTRVESELGVSPPEDYKRVCEAFGPGEFSEYLDILCSNEAGGPDILVQWRACAETADKRTDAALPHPLFAPYNVFERQRPAGLIPWAFTQNECEFYWLSDAGDPNEWPIIARFLDSDWDRYDMSTSEFVVRILTDVDFSPYSVARLFPEVSFEPW